MTRLTKRPPVRDFFDAHVIIDLPDSMSAKTKKAVKAKLKDKIAKEVGRAHR